MQREAQYLARAIIVAFFGSDSVPPVSSAMSAPLAAALVATPAHAAFAFASIARALAGGDSAAAAAAAAATSAAPASFALVAAPFFVSATVAGALRGCLGTLSPRPLAELGAWACKAAFHDERFAPVAAGELASLTVSVSLLHGHELAAGGPEDWTRGEHGIVIEFKDAGSGAQLRGTYLPHVSVEQGWSKTETVRRLIRKAGFAGAPELVLAGLRVTRFRASVASLSYAEFEAMRGGGGADAKS